MVGFRYILKVDPTRFAAALDVGWWEMMIIQGWMTSKFWSEYLERWSFNEIKQKLGPKRQKIFSSESGWEQHR